VRSRSLAARVVSMVLYMKVGNSDAWKVGDVLITQVQAKPIIVKPLAKGQITIPAVFREALGIDADTLLSVSLVADHLEILPLRQGQDALRRYTDEEVSRFLEEDKLDPKLAQEVRDLLG